MKKLFLSLSLAASLVAFGQNTDAQKIQATANQALEMYNSKNYTAAAPKFEEVYNLLKAGGQDDKLYLYYAALSYSLSNNSDKAISIYKNLADTNFTGIETEYFARNKKTNEVEKFDKLTWDLLKKSKDYADFETKATEGVEEELYNNLSILLLQAKQNEEAIKYIEKGLGRLPNNAKLIALKSNALAQSGNKSALGENLKAQLAKDPNNAEAWYNLGVILSEQPGHDEEVIAAYKKATELKPDFVAAWQNLTYATIGDDEKARQAWSDARKAKKNDLAEQIMAKRRENFNKAIPFAEKWHALEPNNIDNVTLLKQLYISTKNDAKAAEFKAKEVALGGGK